MKPEEFKDIRENDVYLAEVPTKQGQKEQVYVIVTGFTERFGVNEGLAFKVMGFHQLIHPRHVTIKEKVEPEKYGEIIFEVHNQGVKHSQSYFEQLIKESV